MLELSWSYRAQWRSIGEELNVEARTLDLIQADHIRDKDCLVELIGWYIKDICATRKKLAMALVSLSEAYMKGKVTFQLTFFII